MSDNSDSPLKWGILSAGMISHDFCTAMSTVDPKEHQILAVAARDPLKAEEFARNHQIPKFHSNYNDLYNDPEIDVIYIGTIHPHHLSTAKGAIDGGKHVLCEKPLCMNARETKELTDYAKSKGKFLMEAIWSRFLPAYKRLVEELAKGSIGQPKSVLATFGTPFDHPRANRKELGGGTVLDRGIYCLQLVHLAFGSDSPIEIAATGHINNQGVDVSVGATLKYSKGRIATFTTDNDIWLPNQAVISGTKGMIKLESPFWCSTKFTGVDGITEEFELPKTPGKEIFFWNSQGLSYQVHEVRRCIQKGLLESPIVPHSESILISEGLEKIRRQVGVSYFQD